ncbi:MAG: prepilin-type N-terminal cleavage/methylation domain-containing protein [Candidatus Eisenbacteria bacterium]|nr:prepilin-type N-terminal cleavage/methylation domain-containing protein [Candidatus Eisenbacteria bacterium]
MRLGQHRGFTLVELLIVVIIVGILAAVAIPLYSQSVDRSKATEAVAALGTIKSAMRNYYAEHVTYVNPNFTDGSLVGSSGILDVDQIDLDSRYFSSDCYTFDGAPTVNTFRIKCDGSASTAPAASEVSHLVRFIDQDGEISNN